MNNFPKPHDNLQDTRYIGPLLNTTNTRTPLKVQEFDKPELHNSNTSPLPAVPPVVHKVTHYPQSWDKAKKLPSPHHVAEIILSNRQFVIVCTVIMSTIFLVYALKLVVSVIAK